MAGTWETYAQVRGLSVAYSCGKKEQVRALDHVDLEVHAGEVLAVIGESGCGKSTLAKALLRLLPSTAKWEGQVFIEGRDIFSLPEGRLRELRGRRISMISQDPALALNPVLTVGTQISEVVRAHLRMKSRDRVVYVHELLKQVGFGDPGPIYRSYPHQLSGGQRQRIVIAQAIACSPRLLVADEPTSKLDASLQREILDLLLQAREQHGTAIVAITHDPHLLRGFADRIAVMYAGTIVESGNCGEVFARPFHPYTQALVQMAEAPAISESGKDKQHFAAIDGKIWDPTEWPAGCRFEPRCSSRMAHCREKTPQQSSPATNRLVSCFKYGD